jgi:hypothetical protein
MDLTHKRHKSRGAHPAASDLNALLSVGHPEEQGSLLRRGGGVSRHAEFVRGFGESNGGGAASEFAVCQAYRRGTADKTYAVVECPHMRVCTCGVGTLKCALQDDAKEKGP